jgi:hypothetical protein
MLAELKRLLAAAELLRSGVIWTLRRRTDQQNEATGSVSELTGRVNVLTGKVNKLTGLNNALTDERNRLVGRVNELTGECNALAGRLAGMARQRGVFRPTGRGTSPASYMGTALLGRPVARTSKFLIVSNMRSGSTWLLTLLGALADVATDFEMKWNVDYAPSPGHFILDERSPTVGEVLERLSDAAPVAGSKVVLDPAALNAEEFRQFAARIGDDVRIVHLERSYRDIFLSRHRGAYHRLAAAGGMRMGEHIKAAIIKADPGVKPSDACAQAVSPRECYEETRFLLENDLLLATLAEKRRYMRIRYEDVAARFQDIVRFVESAADNAACASLLRDPPVEKLPRFVAEQLVSNITELDLFFARLEEFKSVILPSSARSLSVEQHEPEKDPIVSAAFAGNPRARREDIVALPAFPGISTRS